MALAGLAALLLSAAPTEGASCVMVRNHIQKGQTLSATDLDATTTCPAQPLIRAVRYDRTTSSLHTIRDIDAGETIPNLSGFALADVAPGRPLQLRTQIGSVTIVRDVVALQPGWAEGSVFVRTGDGEVFSVLVRDLME